MSDKQAEAAGQAAYTKEQFLTSEAYREHRDILAAILVDSAAYTADEVRRLLEKFNRRKVGP